MARQYAFRIGFRCGCGAMGRSGGRRARETKRRAAAAAGSSLIPTMKFPHGRSIFEASRSFVIFGASAPPCIRLVRILMKPSQKATDPQSTKRARPASSNEGLPHASQHAAGLRACLLFPLGAFGILVPTRVPTRFQLGSNSVPTFDATNVCRREWSHFDGNVAFRWDLSAVHSSFFFLFPFTPLMMTKKTSY